MKKQVFLVLGLVLCITPFLFNSYNVFRVICLLIGIILITIGITLLKKRNILFLITIPITLLIFTYAIDTFLYTKFARMPLFIVEEKSNDLVSTYNSLLYRIYKCDNNYYMDFNYKNNFMCEDYLLDETNINEFLLDDYSLYEKYHNKFIKLSGKISEISSNSKIVLSKYEESDTSLNNFVKFDLDKNVSINVDIPDNKYRIYDDILVVGKVSKKENNTIILEDAIIKPKYLFDAFKVEVNTSKTNDVKEYMDEKMYYLYGIDNIFIKYNDNLIYELKYLIEDERISLDDLISNQEKIIYKDKDDNIIYEGYELENLKIEMCNNKTFFINKNLKFSETLCK